MSDQQARQQLLNLLDKKAFDPILQASPNDYQNNADKEKLGEVQRTTHKTQRSYHEKYQTAQAVRKNFQDDLTSQAAKKVHRELKHLNLPTLAEIKEEFEQLANKLGIH